MAQAEEHKLREYLLGRLTEAEEEQVELRLLNEPDFAGEYDIVVNEVTDDYLAGKLQGDDREQVERHFFKSTKRQNKLRFTSALNCYLTDANRKKVAGSRFLPAPWGSQSFLFRAAAAVALIVIAAGAFWFIRPPTSPPRTLATLTLNISVSNRGAEADIRKISLSSNIDGLKIVLILPEQPPPAARYRVELENINGEKRSLEPASQDARSVTVLVPTADLKPGPYSLKLFAVSANGGEQRIPGNYFLTVE